MHTRLSPVPRRVADRGRSALPSASVAWTEPGALGTLAHALDPPPGSLILLFVSPKADSYRIARNAERAFPGQTVIGCTTAGEITQDGYDDGQIVAVCLPGDRFGHATVLIPDVHAMDPHHLASTVLRERSALVSRTPGWSTEFGITLIDGLSMQEDSVLAGLALSLAPVRLFGGSAGDGTDFRAAFLLHRGQALRNAAIVALVRTAYDVKVFKFDHLVPTPQRMVVTRADPARRIVQELNAEPAAAEYARILGLSAADLSPMTFAAHPVVVRIGDQHHVRSIQRINEQGELVFFSAIDEGVVLTLAGAQPMAEHLDRALDGLARPQAPNTILAFDCILRRIEAEQRQLSGEISHILQKHRVVGFNTYGEHFNAMHVNQTITGLAVYGSAAHEDE